MEKLILQNKTVFTLDELSYIWGIVNDQVLWNKVNYLTKVGKLRRLAQGIYGLESRNPDPFELGNKFRKPSYISFDTVLAREGIIFQYSEAIYLAAQNSLRAKIDNKNYIYRKLKDEILLNPAGIKKEKNYSIASVERAYLDTLYLNPRAYFDKEEKLDFTMCLELVKIYGLDSLTQIVAQRSKNESNWKTKA